MKYFRANSMPRWWEPVVALGIPAMIVIVAVIIYAGNSHQTEFSTANPIGPTETIPAPLPSSIAPHSTKPATPPPAISLAAAAMEKMQSIPTTLTSAYGYERSFFGAGWKDPDRNGCDSRNDILSRDLSDVVYRDGTNSCVVSTGTLSDPYTGMSISFQRGNDTSTLVQIDHIVPLAWAWRNGASLWTDEQRLVFANDPDNLLAVDGASNLQKSDSGPASWMPASHDFWCEYAFDFTTVLADYQLSIPPDDRTALNNVLSDCL